MNTYSAVMSPDGPLVPLEVTLPAAALLVSRTAGTVFQPVTVTALIDTGADATILDPAVLTPVVTAGGLKPTRYQFVNAPGLGGTGISPEYSVGLRVAPVAGQPRSGLVLRTFLVTERPLGTVGYQALIGRDVLSRCLLVIDGPGNRFTLGY